MKIFFREKDAEPINFYLFGKEFFNLYRKLFPFSHKVILYQLYTQNSVEENLIKLIYSRFDEFLLDEEYKTKIHPLSRADFRFGPSGET